MPNAKGYEAADEKLIDKFIQETKNGNPIVGLSEIAHTVVRESFLERWDAKSKQIQPPANENERLERIGVIYLFKSRCVDLVSGLCYDETKWDGGLKCRTNCRVISACFSHPSIDRIWGDVQTCAQLALAAAGAAALLTGAAGAVPAFKASFYGCIVGNVGDWAAAIQVDLPVREDVGNWHWCA